MFEENITEERLELVSLNDTELLGTYEEEEVNEYPYVRIMDITFKEEINLIKDICKTYIKENDSLPLKVYATDGVEHIEKEICDISLNLSTLLKIRYIGNYPMEIVKGKDNIVKLDLTNSDMLLNSIVL